MSEPRTAAGWVRSVYLWLIGVVIGGMLLLNGMDLLRRLRAHLEAWRREESIERMDRTERIQHAAMAVTFVLLAYTGFALRFPDAWWAFPLVAFEERLSLRGWIHRIAGALLIATSLWHLAFLLFTRRGRYELGEMRIRIDDAREALAAVRHNLGLGPAPAAGRFGYVEKIEYWALVWGTIVMSATGLLLWFNNWTMRTFSRIATEVATAIHYYEAWLAVLAIVIWHLYAVIFRADTYPMNWTWLTGRISRRRFHEEHPLEAPPGAGGSARPARKM
jgi:formate dehydrogenase gamma subunit